MSEFITIEASAQQITRLIGRLQLTEQQVEQAGTLAAKETAKRIEAETRRQIRAQVPIPLRAKGKPVLSKYVRSFFDGGRGYQAKVWVVAKPVYAGLLGRVPAPKRPVIGGVSVGKVGFPGAFTGRDNQGVVRIWRRVGGRKEIELQRLEWDQEARNALPRATAAKGGQFSTIFTRILKAQADGAIR